MAVSSNRTTVSLAVSRLVGFSECAELSIQK